MRYFINNYQDPVRQRGIDRILGLIEGDDIRRPVRSLPEIARLMEEDEDEEESDRDKEGEEDQDEEKEDEDSDEDEDKDDIIEEGENVVPDLTTATAKASSHGPSFSSSLPSSPIPSAISNLTQVPIHASNHSGPETEPIEIEEISRSYREKIDTILDELKQLHLDHAFASAAAQVDIPVLNPPAEHKKKPKKSNQVVVIKTSKPITKDRTVTKLGETSSPLRATLRALGKSKVIIFVIGLLIILRFHSAMLMGEIK